ncbi:fimbria/pilus periplasmic chaperone, partial [Shigella sonnei]|uniref:fimbria/pilus periplasmic chaperone n=1 Tax=Shigella sonnei TaxID=624 RepID=UPI00097D46B0
MFFNTKHTTALCFVTCMAFSSSSIADIVISGTRVIYKSDQKSVNVRLENKGNNPLLVQSWLDTGDNNAEPGSITVPFTATPPVSRIDAKRGQTIKLMYTASTSLPKDRESVFWFKEGANKQVISSQADSLIKISRIWADFFPVNTSN